MTKQNRSNPITALTFLVLIIIGFIAIPPSTTGKDSPSQITASPPAKHVIHHPATGGGSSATTPTTGSTHPTTAPTTTSSPARSATPSATAPTTPSPTPSPQPPTYFLGVSPADIQAWSRVNICEEGGNWNVVGPTYSGGLGVLNTNWVAYGGLQFAPDAGLATMVEQIAVAKRIQPYAPDQNGCAAW